MTEAVETATTTVSGTDSATSVVSPEQQNTTATETGQQQEQQQQATTEQKQAPVVPESYAFANLPEGYEINEQQLSELTPLFKDLGLTQEQADKLIAYDAQRALAARDGSEQAAIDQRNAQVGEWEQSLRGDKDFGGANFDANVAIAQKALAEFGSPELSTMLKESGLGSHPEVVRFFHRVGKELAEGSLHRTTTEVPKNEISIVDAFR